MIAIARDKYPLDNINEEQISFIQYKYWWKYDRSFQDFYISKSVES